MIRIAEIAADPLDTIVYASPSLRIGRFRVAPDHPRFQDSGPAGGHIFVFPRSIVRIQHEGEDAFVAGPDVVTYYNRGQVYRRDAVEGREDRCEWFAFAPHVLMDAMRPRDPYVEERPDRPFAMSHGPGDPVAYLNQRRLVEMLAAGDGADGLEVEETMLGVLDILLEKSHRDQKPASGSPAREHTERELAESARIEIARLPYETRSLADLARTLGVSMFHLCRVFRRRTGSTLHEYRNRIRLSAALELLEDPDSDLTEMALSLGYSSHSHFTASFRREFGVTPSRFRNDVARGRSDPRP